MKLETEFKIDGTSTATLRQSLEDGINGVRQHLLALSGTTGPNTEAITKAAADLQVMHTTVEAMAGRLAKAEQIALSLERTAGHLDGTRDLNLRGLKSIASKYDPESYKFDAAQDSEANWMAPEFKDKKAQFSLLMANDHDLDVLEERERKIVLRWRELHDTFSTCHQIMLAHLSRRPAALMGYLKAGGFKSLPGYAEFDPLNEQIKLAAAMDEQEAGSGLEWDPTGVSTLLMPEVYPEFGFRGLVPTVPMPRSPYLYPVEPPFFYAKKAREATDGTPSSNRNLPPQVLTTRNVTFTATKLAAMIQHSTELEEDTIVALASAIRAGLGMAIEAAIESCWINGQSTAISGTTSTFDTGETFDDGSSTLLEDQRRSWNGIRYGCSLTGVVEDASTGFTVDNVSNVAARLGRFGKVRRDTLFVTGYIGEARCLTLRDAHNTAVVLTADKAGGAGTFQTGIMYAMFGRPLYISNEWPENLNGAGVADGGGGTFTSIGLVNTKRIRHGEVRMTRIEASRDWNFAQDQVAVRATYRGVGQFTVTPSATDKSMGLIVGIK